MSAFHGFGRNIRGEGREGEGGDGERGGKGDRGRKERLVFVWGRDRDKDEELSSGKERKITRDYNKRLDRRQTPDEESCKGGKEEGSRGDERIKKWETRRMEKRPDNLFHFG